jgi:hypothetical protein
MSNNNELFLKCDCGSEILQIVENIDYFDATETLYNYNREFYLAIFRYDYKKCSLWNRLKVALRYLIKGTFHKDQLILSECEMNKLMNWVVRSNENFYDECQKKKDENYISTLSIISKEHFEEITGIEKEFKE